MTPPQYGTPNFKNRTLFHGDNLNFLRAMNSGTVDLIATDPPFNKGKDFHATPDSLAAGAKFQDRWFWEKDVHEDWIDQITDAHPKLMEAIQSSRKTHSDSMGAFLCFMAVRLLAMHRILKKTGSIYLHCDPTASHYLKTIMDAIFGHKNFLNEIIWSYQGTANPTKHFKRKHDTILFYGKDKRNVFFNDSGSSEPISDFSKSKFTKRDKRGWYKEIRHPNGTVHKQYRREFQRMRDVWDIPIINAMAKERTGYPTQKPLELYARLIRASTRENEWVLDPFAGCATTLVSAESLGRQWIGIDIWERSKEVIVDRLEKEGLIQKDKKGKKLGQEHLFSKNILFTKQMPSRNDDGENSSPHLQVKNDYGYQKPKVSRVEMFKHFLERYGPKCQGCDRIFEHERYLELDHIHPKSHHGSDWIKNRTLLCGPCNKLKSDELTLKGLRKKNKEMGFMHNHQEDKVST